jgi:ABC transporter substrate binding protein
VNRREFITLLSGAAAWPLAARAQQRERIRNIGVLMSAAAETTDQEAGVGVFMQALHQLGWTEDRNVRVEIRWGEGDPAKHRRYAEELVSLPANVIMVTGNAGLEALLRATRSVPIVFHSVADPVGSGFVESLARPGGNATGFIQFEYTLTGKWLELLKQIAPSVTRVAVLRDPALVAGTGQFAACRARVLLAKVPIALKRAVGLSGPSSSRQSAPILQQWSEQVCRSFEAGQAMSHSDANCAKPRTGFRSRPADPWKLGARSLPEQQPPPARAPGGPFLIESAIPSFPLQPLRPHNARTRARGRATVALFRVAARAPRPAMPSPRRRAA